MSELLRDAARDLAALAAADRELQPLRRGAPPLPARAPGEDVVELERTLGDRLPDDFRAYVTRGRRRGRRVRTTACCARAHAPIAAPAGVTAWRHALPIAHLGCGYAALIAARWHARGQIWIDARALGVVAPIDPASPRTTSTGSIASPQATLARGLRPGRAGVRSPARSTGYLAILRAQARDRSRHARGRRARRGARPRSGPGRSPIAAETGPCSRPAIRSIRASRAPASSTTSSQGCAATVVQPGVAPLCDRWTHRRVTKLPHRLSHPFSMVWAMVVFSNQRLGPSAELLVSRRGRGRDAAGRPRRRAAGRRGAVGARARRWLERRAEIAARPARRRPRSRGLPITSKRSADF